MVTCSFTPQDLDSFCFLRFDDERAANRAVELLQGHFAEVFGRRLTARIANALQRDPLPRAHRDAASAMQRAAVAMESASKARDRAVLAMQKASTAMKEAAEAHARAGNLAMMTGPQQPQQPAGPPQPPARQQPAGPPPPHLLRPAAKVVPRRVPRPQAVVEDQQLSPLSPPSQVQESRHWDAWGDDDVDYGAATTAISSSSSSFAAPRTQPFPPKVRSREMQATVEFKLVPLDLTDVQHGGWVGMEKPEVEPATHRVKRRNRAMLELEIDASRGVCVPCRVPSNPLPPKRSKT